MGGAPIEVTTDCGRRDYRRDVDLSRLKTSDWLLVGGGLGFFIFGFLRWFSVDVGPVTFTENAFDFFFTGTVPWVLVVGSGIVAVLLATGPIRPGSAPWPIVLVAATGIATLLVLLRLIFGREIEGVDLSRSYGLWICLLSAAAALAGAFMKFTESGGELRDLTDVDRLRDSFDRPGSPPPPPPPPRRQQPPPPPPTV